MSNFTRCLCTAIAALTISSTASHAASINILEDNGVAGLSATFDLDAAGPTSVNTSLGWFLGLSGTATTFRFSNRSGAASTITFDANVDHFDISTAIAATGDVEPVPLTFFFDAGTQSGGFSFGNAAAPVNPNTPSPVPLPASALLLLGGVAGLGAMRKARKS